MRAIIVTWAEDVTIHDKHSYFHRNQVNGLLMNNKSTE